MNFGLTPEQLDQRKQGVGGSDAGRVMTGDWRKLWLEKTNRAKPEDLSGNLAVAMGHITEQFNAYWFAKTTGRAVERRSERVKSDAYPFMLANLDGVTTTSKGASAYWDAKHVGRSDEAMVLRYTPQMVHCATIIKADWWVLSVLIGNSKFEVIEQEVDPLYQATLIARERDFWGFVERDEEPPEEAPTPVLAPKPQPKLRTLHVPTEEDEVFAALCRRENWLAETVGHIRPFVSTHAAATKHAIEREAIKSLVPEDVGELVFGRYRLARTKAGAVTMSVKPLEGDDNGQL